MMDTTIYCWGRKDFGGRDAETVESHYNILTELWRLSWLMLMVNGELMDAQTVEVYLR